MDDNRQEQTYDGPAGMNPDGIIESNYSESYDNFDQMGLREELLRGIYAYGFEKPSAIQQRAIVPCVKGSDVIAQAQSGKCCWLPRFGESLPERRACVLYWSVVTQQQQNSVCVRSRKKRVSWGSSLTTQ